MLLKKTAFRRFPRKMNANRKAQSQCHEKSENGGVAVRGTEEGS